MCKQSRRRADRRCLDTRDRRSAGGVIEKAQTAALIDEIPALAVLGAASEEGLTVRDAVRAARQGDRPHRDHRGEFPPHGPQDRDPRGRLQVPGRQSFHAAELDSFGDHRIAMAFSVAALAADGTCDASTAPKRPRVSFPGIFRYTTSHHRINLWLSPILGWKVWFTI